MKSVLEFQARKEQGWPISMVTCYDYSSAVIVSQSKVDCILVGDSASQVMHGAKNTTGATMEQMILHTRSVAQAENHPFLIADMPLMSYRKGLSQAMENIEALVRAGAQAIKLEGAKGNLEVIQHSVHSGVPVMGHLGLTPQHVHQLGGHKVQGKDPEQHPEIINDAIRLQEAGCFAVVLECVPATLAKTITQNLKIPTIGIGAGSDTNGQVLVWHDLLGLNLGHRPKFVKSYLEAGQLFKDCLNQYVVEVVSGDFPKAEQSYKVRSYASD